MQQPLDTSLYRDLLNSFLTEDIGAGDITTNSIVPAARRACGEVVAKAPLVLAGMDLFVEVFKLLDPGAKADVLQHDGEELKPGEVPVRIRATARALLSGERVALNVLQRLSGVATLTRQYVRAVEGTKAWILDTRKTMPGLRALDKYAVRVGGGHNHRNDLGAAVLIKDNHIRLAGGVSPALEAVQVARKRAAWIEVEVTSMRELQAALGHGPDVVMPEIIMLDNMPPAMVRECVQEVRKGDPEGKIRIEASGGVTLDNVRRFAEAGVDWISVGALTHSAPAVDISFEIEAR